MFFFTLQYILNVLIIKLAFLKFSYWKEFRIFSRTTRQPSAYHRLKSAGV